MDKSFKNLANYDEISRFKDRNFESSASRQLLDFESIFNLRKIVQSEIRVHSLFFWQKIVSTILNSTDSSECRIRAIEEVFYHSESFKAEVVPIDYSQQYSQDRIEPSPIYSPINEDADTNLLQIEQYAILAEILNLIRQRIQILQNKEETAALKPGPKRKKSQRNNRILKSRSIDNQESYFLSLKHLKKEALSSRGRSIPDNKIIELFSKTLMSENLDLVVRSIQVYTQSIINIKDFSLWKSIRENIEMETICRKILREYQSLSAKKLLETANSLFCLNEDEAFIKKILKKITSIPDLNLSNNDKARLINLSLLFHLNKSDIGKVYGQLDHTKEPTPDMIRVLYRMGITSKIDENQWIIEYRRLPKKQFAAPNVSESRWGNRLKEYLNDKFGLEIEIEYNAIFESYELDVAIKLPNGKIVNLELDGSHHLYKLKQYEFRDNFLMNRGIPTMRLNLEENEDFELLENDKKRRKALDRIFLRFSHQVIDSH